MHPIVELQTHLLAHMLFDDELMELVGEEGIFDAPPPGRPAPYVVIDRHDIRQRDGDTTPGQEHRVMIHCWADSPSRKAALEIAERVIAARLALEPEGLTVTLAEHVRTETVIDGATGHARAAVLLRFLTE
jgi:hypothetical protein